MAERILIIEDDILGLNMTEHILKNTYEVICAKSGEKGIEILREEDVDLALLNLDMPHMDGLKTLAKIRQDADTAGVKVAMLKGVDVNEGVTEAIQLGAVGFIEKPFFPTELLEKVRDILQETKRDSILVVDDSRFNLMVVKGMLEGRYDVTCVSSGKEALEYLQETMPDLVLLDLHMPGMSGLEVIGKMHEMEGRKDIPVVFLTADSGQKTEAEIFEAGAMDYIQKPFEPKVVMHRISRILELYHFQKSLQYEVDKKTVEIREINRKVTNLSRQVMTALASAIDAKDTYTNGHSLRVAEYSSELARRMGKDAQAIIDIYNIGLLHDIGKIGIPNEIINKPGRLTDEEYAIMQSHPAIGAKILGNISEMPDISIGARWHHERYDGRGYPDGLVGADIPEIARIIGVADAYDAMSSKRSYRDVLSQEMVRDEIAKGRGSQFDPEIADLMLAMIEEDTEYNMREK